MSTSPTFLIPGALKSGTTSLHYYLAEHDDVFLPEHKEVHFFERDSEYSKGLEYYEQQFDEQKDESAIGESSPPYWYYGMTYADENATYRWNPEFDAPTRIRDAYPDLKIIISLRNPITRLYSQYWKNVRQGRERIYSVKEAVKSELEGERSHRNTHLCWVYKNRYDVHIDRWLDLFDRDQLLFIVFEEWIQNPAETLADICRFIGVEPLDGWSRTSQARNTAQTPRSLWFNEFYHDNLKGTILGKLLFHLNLRDGYPDMDPETASFLYGVFREMFVRVESRIGVDLDIWREEASRMADEPDRRLNYDLPAP